MGNIYNYYSVYLNIFKTFNVRICSIFNASGNVTSKQIKTKQNKNKLKSEFAKFKFKH